MSLSLDLQIDRVGGKIYICGLPASFTGFSIASNIDFILYSGKDYQGAIIYNDRPRLPEVLTDLSPYQPVINQWITGTPSLTLAQAKAVKTAFIDALYNVKRQAPVHVTTTAGTYDWDSSDSALQQLAPVNTLNLLTALNSLINATGEIASDTDNVYGGALVNDLMTVGAANLTPPYTILPLSNAIPATLTPPTVSVIPIGQTSAVSLTTADITAISSAVLSRRATLQSGAVSRNAAVNALGTVASVASYDAVTGW